MLRAHRHCVSFSHNHDSEGLPCARESPCLERVTLDELVFSVLVVTQDVADARVVCHHVHPVDAYLVGRFVKEYLAFTPPRRKFSR